MNGNDVVHTVYVEDCPGIKWIAEKKLQEGKQKRFSSRFTHDTFASAGLNAEIWLCNVALHALSM